MNRFLRANRALWDEWTEIHQRAYPVDKVKAGWNSLWPLEREEVGDVAGKSLLHLQCHFGADTISWARLGATVTGVDFSPQGIRRARELADAIGIDARFIESDISALPDKLDEVFDVVYTSYGVLTWLPDIRRWAEVVARYVAPGGVFYIAEFHPILYVFDDKPDTPLIPRFRYFTHPEPEAFEVSGSYADRTAKTKQTTEYEWSHGLGEIVTALIDAGLRIEFVREHPFSVHALIPHLMEESEDGYVRWKDPNNHIPLMFSIRGRKD